jgi:hypothetical protein
MRQVTAAAMTMLGESTVSTLSRLSALVAVPVSVAFAEALPAAAAEECSLASPATHVGQTLAAAVVSRVETVAAIEPGDIDASLDDPAVPKVASVTLRRRSKPVAVAAAGGPLLTNLKQQSIAGKGTVNNRQPRVPFQEIGNF